MKTVYLVRHGQSEVNIGDVYQPEDSPLTEKGRTQAEQVADRASRLIVHALISSTMPRALETAGVVGKKIELPVTPSELFVERRRPSEQRGLERTSPEALAIEKEFIRSSSEADYRYSDEENFDDLMGRSKQALDFLAVHPSDQLVVVTHGIFLRVLVARILFGDALTPAECGAILGTLTTTNTGISVFTHEAGREKPWLIATWNDHAHLG